MASKESKSEATQVVSDCITQNLTVIWLDQNIDQSSAEHKKSIKHLQKVVNTIEIFTDAEECIHYISNIKTKKVFLISSGTLGQKAVPRLHDMIQVNAIYIFCGNKAQHEEWVKKYSKIKGIFTSVKAVSEALERIVREFNHKIISMSFIITSNDAMNKNLNQLDPCFVYAQILKEILLSINFEKQHLKEFLNYSQEQFANNETELDNIAKFGKYYYQEKPIYWYINSRFLTSMLNRAFYNLEIGLMMKLGFFIHDLHEHITQLYTEQYFGQGHSSSFIVYRGQSLSQIEFDQLKKTQGGLLSFNSFLSASKNYQLSVESARKATENSDSIGVMFLINIDPSIPSTPFANIHNINSGKTDEDLLFSMHSIFRIGEIKNITENNRLWKVTLSLTSDKDPQLHTLIEYIREETYPQMKGWYRLGDSLIKFNQFKEAQQVFLMMLNETSDNVKAGIYHKLGIIDEKQGEYTQAIKFYKHSLEINQRILPPTHPDLCDSYSCLGRMHEKTNTYSKALPFLEKALEIQQKILPPNHPDLAISYQSMGNIYNKIDNYSKALSFQEKAYEIYQKTLPSHHPDLAISSYNIGNIYHKMHDYSKAISWLEKAVNIGQSSLAPNDLNLQQWKNDLEIVKNISN